MIKIECKFLVHDCNFSYFCTDSEYSIRTFRTQSVILNSSIYRRDDK